MTAKRKKGDGKKVSGTFSWSEPAPDVKIRHADDRVRLEGVECVLRDDSDAEETVDAILESDAERLGILVALVSARNQQREMVR